MKPKHTPGPWRKSIGDGQPVVMCGAYRVVGAVRSDRGRADVARIVDCVNACEGINPEAVPAMLEALERIEASQTRSDRRHRGMVDISIVEDLQRVARAAIAQAKGDA